MVSLYLSIRLQWMLRGFVDKIDQHVLKARQDPTVHGGEIIRMVFAYVMAIKAPKVDA